MSISHIELKLDEFEPLTSILSGHIQTVIGHLVPSITSEQNTQEEILMLPDGDSLHLQFVDQKSDFTLSLYHGLAGSAQADYIRRSAAIAQRLGWNIILVNHRGATSKALSQKTYHSGRGEDASAVIEWSRQKFPSTRQIALGFSMSGSILLNLVTGRYGDAQPDYAVVVNAPLDLSRCAFLLTQGFSKIYDYRFYLILKNLLKEKNISNSQLPILGPTRLIDEFYTSKINGFKDAQDYYEQCSTINYLNLIQTKTFVLMAYDDPFIDVSDYLKANWNKNAHLTLSQHGGHMGYFSRKKDPKYGFRWLDHYLESVFEKIQTI